jgi:hypothetical protein
MEKFGIGNAQVPKKNDARGLNLWNIWAHRVCVWMKVKYQDPKGTRMTVQCTHTLTAK